MPGHFSSKYDINRHLSLLNIFVQGRSIRKRVRLPSFVRLFHCLSVFSIVCPSFPLLVRLFNRLSVFSVVWPSFPSFVRLFYRLAIFSIVCPSFPSFGHLFHRLSVFFIVFRLFHRCPSFPSFTLQHSERENTAMSISNKILVMFTCAAGRPFCISVYRHECFARASAYTDSERTQIL